MLDFDRKGFLVPDQGLSCTLEEMRRVFVTGFPGSDARLVIFEKFTEFCKDLLLAMQVNSLIGCINLLKPNPIIEESSIVKAFWH